MKINKKYTELPNKLEVEENFKIVLNKEWNEKAKVSKQIRGLKELLTLRFESKKQAKKYLLERFGSANLDLFEIKEVKNEKNES